MTCDERSVLVLQNPGLPRLSSVRRSGTYPRNPRGRTFTSMSSRRGRRSRRCLRGLAMPRKRWRTRLSSYDVVDIDPNVPVPVEDHYLVRHALVDFDELAMLSNETREQLVADLV